MNPYLNEDLVTLGDHARRFATERIAPGYRSATTRAYSTVP